MIACFWLALLPVVFGINVPAGTAAVASSDPERVAGVRITHLANEGFLLQSPGGSILIDAFLAEPHSIYEPLRDADLRRMMGAEPPFDDVRLALASHIHRDHIQPDVAVGFLQASPGTRLVSSPDVVAAVREAAGEARVERLAEVWPGLGESETHEQDGFRVEMMRLSHGSGRFATLQNLGHVIDIAGVRVAHLGDAEMEPASFTPHGGRLRDVQVALIPYWYFLSEEGNRIAGEYFGAALHIAAHIPPAERDEIRKQLADTHPEVVVLAPGESRQVSPSSPTRKGKT